MNLFETERDGVLVLRPSGQLDSANSAEFEQAVRQRIEAGRSRLVLDFNELAYISSAGLRALLVLSKLLNEQGGKLEICSLNSTVSQVFEVTGFTSFLSIHVTLEEALGGQS